MYLSFTDFQFWLLFALFFPLVFITFYVPGKILLQRLKINNSLTQFVIANALGIAMWGIQGYVLGYAGLRFLTYFYILISVIIFMVKFMDFKKEITQLVRKALKNALLSGFIFIASVMQIMAVFFSGIKFSEGVKFFGNSSADGVMHLAYIQSIVSNFPPEEPGFTGTLIRNYHYWSDLVIADFVRIWNFPVPNVFFQFGPLYLAILIGMASYVLIRSWGGTKKMSFWFLFLIYFASDAAYLILIVLQKPFGFYTPAIDSGMSQFLNMPHVFGKLIFIAGLIAFHYWIKKKTSMWGIVTVILFASLFGFKVYFGIFAAIGLCFIVLYKITAGMIRKELGRNDLKNALLFIFFAIFSLAIFLPHNLGAGGFVYVYLEWPRSLLGYGSIDWRDWWLRRQVYETANNKRNLFILDFIAVIIAFVSIYGTRLLGFFITPGLLRFFGTEKVLFLMPGLLIFHVLGLFTIQKSGGVNVFNFFSVSAVILSIFTAYLIAKIRLRGFGILIALLFIGLTLPRTVYELYIGVTRPASKDFRLINNNELEALEFIINNSGKDEIVLSHPANSLDRESPYVAFFSKRSSYLSGGSLLATHNVDINERRNFLDEVFKSTEIVDFATKVRQRGISYLYIQKNPEQAFKFEIDGAHLKKVFENSSILVLKVN